MDKKYLLQITNELYRLTLLFPKKEPLRYKMRELADDILADSLRNTNKSDSSNKCNEERARYIEEDLEVLDGFFEVAKAQNWVSPTDILNLQKEYIKLKGQLKLKIEPIKSEVKLTEVRPLQNSINERQEKILAVLKEKEKAQVWQIKQIFPEVSKRTLRRDFENLFKRGIIKRMGDRNETFYQLKEG
jgi:Fic family protein